MNRSLLYLAIALCSGTVLCQTAAPLPPVKMGLWEKKIVTTGASPEPMTMTAKSCVTPETWQQMATNAMKSHPGCTMKTTPAPHGFSFNATCTLDHGVSMNVTGSSNIQDSTHIVAQSHSTSTVNGKTREMDTQSTSTFVSPDCGKIKPGEPEVNRH
jgi:hypothetical protein